MGKKIVKSNGYILGVADINGYDGDNATEVAEIERVLSEKPTAPSGYKYALLENLTWELQEQPQGL